MADDEVRFPPEPGSVRGADRDIPNTYSEVPPGYVEGGATHAEVVAAGLAEDLPEAQAGQQPADEFLVEGEQMIPPDVATQMLRESTIRVLRDPAGKIVATWDEGRWWTAAESAEFVRQLVAEIRGER